MLNKKSLQAIHNNNWSIDYFVVKQDLKLI
jgi:hypothetical protein